MARRQARTALKLIEHINKRRHSIHTPIGKETGAHSTEVDRTH